MRRHGVELRDVGEPVRAEGVDGPAEERGVEGVGPAREEPADEQECGLAGEDVGEQHDDVEAQERVPVARKKGAASNALVNRRSVWARVSGVGCRMLAP